MRENTTEWTDRQEDVKQKKLEEERKVERLKTCERERRRFEKGVLKDKIVVALETLPLMERENFLAKEERERKLEMKSVKENLWKKWRNRRAETMPKSGEEKEFERSELEKKLEKLDRIIERIKSEEREREERRERDKERKRSWRKEKEKEESKMLVRELERK